jgi:hypothetical protein
MLYEVMNFMRNILIWIRVLAIRVPKEIWYQIEQLYWDEKIK